MNTKCAYLQCRGSGGGERRVGCAVQDAAARERRGTAEIRAEEAQHTWSLPARRDGVFGEARVHGPRVNRPRDRRGQVPVTLLVGGTELVPVECGGVSDWGVGIRGKLHTSESHLFRSGARNAETQNTRPSCHGDLLPMFNFAISADVEPG